MLNKVTKALRDAGYKAIILFVDQRKDGFAHKTIAIEKPRKPTDSPTDVALVLRDGELGYVPFGEWREDVFRIIKEANPIIERIYVRDGKDTSKGAWICTDEWTRGKPEGVK